MRAVEYLHGQGIMHRDLKLENMLLENGNVKLSDFGCATFCHSDIRRGGARHRAHCTTTCGSPNYIAPEMLRCPTYDAALADVWSCGVILYALLTGHLPFAVADDVNDQGNAHLFKQIVVGRFEKPDGMSSACEHLLSGVLQVDPAVRYSVDSILSDRWYCVSPPLSPTEAGTEPDASTFLGGTGRPGSGGNISVLHIGSSGTPIEGGSSPAWSDGSSSFGCMSPVQLLGGGGSGPNSKGPNGDSVNGFQSSTTKSMLNNLEDIRTHTFGTGSAPRNDTWTQGTTRVVLAVPDGMKQQESSSDPASKEGIPPIVNAFELLSMCSHMKALRLGCAVSAPSSMRCTKPDGSVCQPPMALAAIRSITPRRDRSVRGGRVNSTATSEKFDPVICAALPSESTLLAPLVQQSSCFVAEALPSHMLQCLQEALLATVMENGGSEHSCSCTVFEDRAKGTSGFSSLAFFWIQGRQHSCDTSRVNYQGGLQFTAQQIGRTGGRKQVGLEATFRRFPASTASGSVEHDCATSSSRPSAQLATSKPYLVRFTHVHGEAGAFVSLCDAFIARGGIPGIVFPVSV